MLVTHVDNVEDTNTVSETISIDSSSQLETGTLSFSSQEEETGTSSYSVSHIEEGTASKILNSGLKVVYTNADSLLNKRDELLAIIEIDKPDIIVVTELLPKNREKMCIVANEFYVENYNMFIHDTQQHKGRGVAIYVSCKLTALQISQAEFNHIEVISVKIKLKRNDWLLCRGVYRSPNSANESLRELNSVLSEDRDNLHKFSHILIVGDFNYKEINWVTETTTVGENHPATVFLELIRDSFLYQHVKNPTRYRDNEIASMLDLVLTNEMNMIEEIDYLPPLGKSDHLVLSFTLILYTDQKVRSGEKFNFYKADYNTINDNLREIDWNSSICQVLSTDKAWENFTDIIYNQFEDNIPVCKVLNPKHNTPWMNDEALKAVRKKRKCWNKYIHNKTTENKTIYDQIKRICSRAIRQSKTEYESNLAENIKTNTKPFWNYVRTKTKTKESIGNLVDKDGILKTDNYERADILNEFFVSVFTRENMQNFPNFPVRTDQSFNNITISIEIIEKYIRKLKVSKSMGPDKFHPKFLVETVETIKKPLNLLFNKSLQEGKIPDPWRLANITPIHKKGSKSKSENYRPISLTSVCSKLMEKIIRDQLMIYMESNNLFSEHQHGFRSGRSCTTQLLEVCDKWSEELDNKNSVDVIYFDFQKAFDSVPHQRLLIKLTGYGIGGHILAWIKDFLKNRQQRVVVNGVTSEWAPVTSGIPQGSVLGPVLFLIYINDIPDTIHNILKLFADDSKLFGKVNTIEEAEILQDDVYRSVDWSERWQLKFNNTKSKHMHLGPERGFSKFYMSRDRNTDPIKTVHEEKDLGVTFDSKLKFSVHIQNCVKTANRNLGIVRRTFAYLNKTSFLHLYKSIIRPHLEYGSSVWPVMYKKDSIAIENVQRRATKILPALRNKSYPERLIELGLPSLQYRRLRFDMIQVYRILNNIDHCDQNQLFTRDTITTTRGHSLKLYKRSFRLDIRRHSFSQRVINQWNSLPENVVSAKNLNQFKSKLNMHWKSLPIKFQPDCYTAYSQPQYQYQRRIPERILEANA